MERETLKRVNIATKQLHAVIQSGRAPERDTIESVLRNNELLNGDAPLIYRKAMKMEFRRRNLMEDIPGNSPLNWIPNIALETTYLLLRWKFRKFKRSE